MLSNCPDQLRDGCVAAASTHLDPLRLIQEILEVRRQRLGIYPKRNDWMALGGCSLEFLADVCRYHRVFREDEDQDRRFVDRSDDAARIQRARDYISRGDPAGEPCGLQRRTHPLCQCGIMRRITDEHAALRAGYTRVTGRTLKIF